jgi:hydrogenase maturation protease
VSRTLVAGIGNIFFRDDAFGVEVAGRLVGRLLPDGVRVEDFGIRGVHLAYELLDGYDTLVLVDALSTGEAPGTVSVFEPSLDDLPGAAMDAHTMDPGTVLATLAGLGGRVEQVLIVGCEPEAIDEGMGLSAPVAAAVDVAAQTVMDLVGATQVVSPTLEG